MSSLVLIGLSSIRPLAPPLAVTSAAWTDVINANATARLDPMMMLRSVFIWFLFSFLNLKAVIHSIRCRRLTDVRRTFDFAAHLAEPPLCARVKHLVAAMTIEAGRIAKRRGTEMKCELVTIGFWVSVCHETKPRLAWPGGAPFSHLRASSFITRLSPAPLSARPSRFWEGARGARRL